ncbi:IST1 homolog isoform X6 [Apostichopus japonicus]|uniref:IST1 homolog isoform X6 n=1 Tax=Stichopus japonicus TaxID=307972 RepID=UPI003AB7FC61
MFSGGYRSQKLRTHLRLAINRLKLMEKKKTELAQKARKEIADYIAAAKDDRARIRVEHIIREDYLVEAMEMVELYCDMLLARFGMIESMKHVDEGLQEAITSIIWVTPRMTTEVPELKVVSDQLFLKYGKEFGRLALINEMGTVNDRLVHKLKVDAPPKILVERYLIEIAKSHNIPYEPDTAVLNGEQIEDLLVQLDDDAPIPSETPDKNNKPGGPPGGGSAPGGYGGGGAGGYGGPPGPGNAFSGPGNAFSGPVMHDPSMAYPPPQAPQAPQPYDPPRYSLAANDPAYPPPQAQPMDPGKPHPAPRGVMPTPSSSWTSRHDTRTPISAFRGSPSANHNDGGDDLDFDELSKRFEDLTKKK